MPSLPPVGDELVITADFLADCIDITDAEGYWQENLPKTRYMAIVRAKMDFASLGGREGFDTRDDIIQGYCGFIRYRLDGTKNAKFGFYKIAGTEGVLIRLEVQTRMDVFQISSWESRVVPIIVDLASGVRKLLGLFRIQQIQMSADQPSVTDLVLIDSVSWAKDALSYLKFSAPRKRYKMTKCADSSIVPVTVLGPGIQCLPVFLRLIDDACRNLRICIFLLDCPRFETAIAEATARIAHLRVLINDVNKGGSDPFSVPLLWSRQKVNYRCIQTIYSCEPHAVPIMHAKLVIADSIDFDATIKNDECEGLYAMGSMNPTRPGTSYNIECAMRTEVPSPGARTMAHQFDVIWNSCIEMDT